MVLGCAVCVCVCVCVCVFVCAIVCGWVGVLERTYVCVVSVAWVPCACVCMCVSLCVCAKESIRICSNCEVQQS